MSREPGTTGWTYIGDAAPTPALATRAAIVVNAHIALRDALLRLGVGHQVAAGQLWTRLAAQHRGATRANLLAMAAFTYYAGDDGVRAGIALDHAIAAARGDDAPVPRLAQYLTAALEPGMPPHKIREIIPTREAAPIPGTDL